MKLKAALTRSLIQWSLLHWWVIDESSLRKWRPFTRSFSGWSLICDAMISDKMMACYTIINAMKHVFLLMRMTASKAQVFATRCEIPFNNRQTKISCRSLRFASDLGSEAKRNESAMIGGFPWETRHNYPSMMAFYTIIFSMMTHHHWINEAMIIELMIE